MAQTTLPQDPISSNYAPVPFAFKNHQIRTVVNGGDTPWFVARDVSKALGIFWSGATLKNIPPEWVRVLKLNIRQKNDTERSQDFSVISEPAVYKLAFRSNKPEAEEFSNWVASVVLPSIRKTGKFEAQAPLTLSTASDRKPLRALVHAWSTVSGMDHAMIYTQLQGHFNLTKIDQLPLAWIPDALAFVQARIDAAQTKALPEPPMALPSTEATWPNPDPHKPLPMCAIQDDLATILSMARRIGNALFNRRHQIGRLRQDDSQAQAMAERRLYEVPGQMSRTGEKLIEEGLALLSNAAESTEALVTVSRKGR